MSRKNKIFIETHTKKMNFIFSILHFIVSIYEKRVISIILDKFAASKTRPHNGNLCQKTRHLTHVSKKNFFIQL